MRSAYKYKQSGPGGGVEALGYQPLQEKEAPYEFDVLCETNMRHQFRVLGSRFDAIDGKVFAPLGDATAKASEKVENLGLILADLLTDSGAALPADDATPAARVPPEVVERIRHLQVFLGVSDEKMAQVLADRGVARAEDLEPERATGLIAGMEARVKQLREQDAPEVVAASEATTETPPTVDPSLGDTQKSRLVNEITSIAREVEMPDVALTTAVRKRNPRADYVHDLQVDQLEDLLAAMKALRDRRRATAVTPEPAAQAGANSLGPGRPDIATVAPGDGEQGTPLGELRNDVFRLQKELGFPDEALTKVAAGLGGLTIFDLDEAAMIRVRDGWAKKLADRRALNPEGVASIVNTPPANGAGRPATRRDRPVETE